LILGLKKRRFCGGIDRAAPRERPLMKRGRELCVVASMALCLAASGAKAQTANPNDKSLGKLARELKAQKSKAPKPVKVFTNDNLPPASSQTARSESSSEKKPANEVGPIKPEGKAPEAHDEKYYRSHMSELQSNLDMHKRELDVLQEKLGINQTQYYSDPNKTLQQEYTRGDIDKLTQEINAKKQQIADDEKAIEDLHQQLRREGGDPGWLR
jgi:predicted RNase H-like nuclease (RuvC/YqgF family)